MMRKVDLKFSHDSLKIFLNPKTIYREWRKTHLCNPFEPFSPQNAIALTWDLIIQSTHTIIFKITLQEGVFRHIIQYT